MQVVVSHYSARSAQPLLRLIDRLLEVTNKICVVINEDWQGQFHTALPMAVTRITRPNLGMNLGGWQEAARQYPKQSLLFLQDECLLERNDAISTYEAILSQPDGPVLIGETINPRWDRPWKDLEDDDQLGQRATRYREYLAQSGVSLAPKATHLRTLAIGISSRFNERFCNLPMGQNKEECIALEIGLSQCAITEFGGLAQSNIRPFHYFSHVEWRSDGLGKK